MFKPFPPIVPVRVRGSGARTTFSAGARDEEATFAFHKDATAAMGIVADTLGAPPRGERSAADLVVETCTLLFRGRSTSVLDDLAEVWWRAEHGDGSGGVRPRPFSTLPVGERVEVRERARSLLERRVPDTIGDVAVLEAEARSVLEIAERAIDRANGSVYRRAERDRRWRGHGATTACVIFSDGRASIAHAGNCRVARIRRGDLEALTTEHTLENDLANLQGTAFADVEELPRDIVTRALGMSDRIEVGRTCVPLEAGDVFVLATAALWRSVPAREIVASLRTHGAQAATSLCERGRRGRPDAADLAVVVVEVR